MSDEQAKPSESSEASAAPAASETPATPPPASRLPSYATKLSGMTDVKSGMTVKIHEKIKDVTAKGEERERIQIFEGTILRVRGAGKSKTIIVRKVTHGFGVEKIYPLNSPVVDKIELIKTAETRRAHLTYLSGRKKKSFRRNLKEKWEKKS
ncbi:50S ribosomal protein L19 [Candidatus Uhrbacteria bacterium]|nr:50S ribosomal protein L19 [Candidatus Uhrbacteria bacterium]